MKFYVASSFVNKEQAGGVVVDFNGNDFDGNSLEPYLVACHPDHKDYFLKTVSDGLKVAEETLK